MELNWSRTAEWRKKFGQVIKRSGTKIIAKLGSILPRSSPQERLLRKMLTATNKVCGNKILSK